MALVWPFEPASSEDYERVSISESMPSHLNVQGYYRKLFVGPLSEMTVNSYLGDFKKPALLVFSAFFSNIFRLQRLISLVSVKC